MIGYLKRVSNFSTARQAEHELRYYHKSMLHRTAADNVYEQEQVVANQIVNETAKAEKAEAVNA